MISSAKYIISSPDVKDCPHSSLPEYAFIGRSNVGKSSLINMLCHNPKLAKTSQKPGKTLLINHFEVTTSPQPSPQGREKGTSQTWHLVDLPGVYQLVRRERRTFCKRLYQRRQVRKSGIKGQSDKVQRTIIGGMGRVAAGVRYFRRNQIGRRRVDRLY